MLRRVLFVAVPLLAAVFALLAWKPHLALAGEYARLRWLAGAVEHDLDAAGHRWAYLEAGPAEAPTVVLVHGFTGLKESWLPLMRALRRDYRTIAPDLAGWNASSREAGAEYGIAAQAERLAAFLEALGGDPPVLLVGHSMGGHIAGVLAARRPDLAPRLALMASAGVPFRDNDFTRALYLGEHPFAVIDRDSLRRYLRLVFTEPPFLPWPADRALIDLRRADLDFERRVLGAITSEAEAFLLDGLLPELRQPVGLLWCSDDQVIDVSAGEYLAEAITQARLVVLEGCGHMPQMAVPEATAEVLRGFARAERE